MELTPEDQQFWDHCFLTILPRLDAIDRMEHVWISPAEEICEVAATYADRAVIVRRARMATAGGESWE